MSDQDPKVKCEVCMKEIPKSEAKSPETVDYVMYFCGLECYAKWQAQAQTKKSDDR